MKIYDLIYSFIHDNFFLCYGSGNSDLSNYETTIMSRTIGLDTWLSHTCTIGIMILCVILACLLVRWVWRVVSSAFLLK